KVVCAECGKETEVPFEPKNDRPVYCRDCFNKKRGEAM
ncbi:MAG: zinc-binding protein, partial [Selenomonas sp.]|nr:zinc-binding protein [Selenomonas sp.]